jgi:hypothetical protein
MVLLTCQVRAVCDPGSVTLRLVLPQDSKTLNKLTFSTGGSLGTPMTADYQEYIVKVAVQLSLLYPHSYFLLDYNYYIVMYRS